jgi:uncharacterized membrane protein
MAALSIGVLLALAILTVGVWRIASHLYRLLIGLEDSRELLRQLTRSIQSHESR